MQLLQNTHTHSQYPYLYPFKSWQSS